MLSSVMESSGIRSLSLNGFLSVSDRRINGVVDPPAVVVRSRPSAWRRHGRNIHGDQLLFRFSEIRSRDRLWGSPLPFANMIELRRFQRRVPAARPGARHPHGGVSVCRSGNGKSTARRRTWAPARCLDPTDDSLFEPGH